MALGEVGSYLAALVLAVVAYSKLPISIALLQVLTAVLVFCVSSKTFHWFVHLGYEPDVED